MTTHEPGSRGRCPHCLTVVKFESLPNLNDRIVLDGVKENLLFINATCPECGKLILTVKTGTFEKLTSPPDSPWRLTKVTGEFILWPLQTTRPVPEEVPQHIAADYKEAATVLNISPKASAALSRRCLQIVLVEAGGAKPKGRLVDQIDDVRPNLPSYIAEDIDSIRKVGNFAAHPMKDTTTGQIVNVEPGEAEWNLDVLDLLFDFYYVLPAQAKKKRDALTAKLQAAGKKPRK